MVAQSGPPAPILDLGRFFYCLALVLIFLPALFQSIGLSLQSILGQSYEGEKGDFCSAEESEVSGPWVGFENAADVL